MSAILINPFVSFPTNVGGATDPDAAAYVAAVESADGDVLEAGVVQAIDNFVIGCKADGIWSAIKASCIMAGARTLDGALVPLVGAAPTNFNFVAGDYSRTTGLVGDGSTKYLSAPDANHVGIVNASLAVFIAEKSTAYSTAFSPTIRYIGAGLSYGASYILPISSSDLNYRLAGVGAKPSYPDHSTGFLGCQRLDGDDIAVRKSGVSLVRASSGAYPVPSPTGIVVNTANGRLSYYSIGEALDLALLDARVSTLMTDIAAAIP